MKWPDKQQWSAFGFVFSLCVLGVLVLIIFYSAVTSNHVTTEKPEKVIVFSTVDGMPNVGVVCIEGVAIVFTKQSDPVPVPELNHKYCDPIELNNG